MDFLGLSSAINGGLELSLNGALGIANLLFQKNAYKQQMQMQKDMFNANVAMNDPAYIRARREAAGLNVYGGDFQQMGVSQPTPVSASGVAEAYNGLMSSLSRGHERMFNAIAMRLTKKQLELQEKKVDLDYMLTDEQINNLRSQTAYQDIVNEVAEATKGSNIELSALQVDNLLSQVLTNATNLDFLPQKLRAEIRKLDAETNKIDYDWKQYLPAMLALNQRLGDSTIDLNQKNLEKIAEEITSLQTDNIGFKELKKTIDKMDDGAGKSFLKVLLNVLMYLAKNK